MKVFGDYHIHTRYGDGHATVIENVRAAKDRGLSEIAITEHGFGGWLNGISRKNFEKLSSEVESGRCEMPILLGMEANLVSLDGRIDLTDDQKARLDILLFGVHICVGYSVGAFFGFFLPNMFWKMLHWTPRGRIRKNTNAVKRAIERNRIDIWTHPNRYFRLDVVEVAKTCAMRGTFVELNSKKISFRPIDFERMERVGAKFIVNSDAHWARDVGEMTRVEEFLKNCDFDEKNIINLGQTYTNFRFNREENDISTTNQGGNIDTGSHKRWWRKGDRKNQSPQS